MTEAFAVRNAPALRPIEADAVHFVEIGHGIVRIRDVAEFRDRRDIAVHRVDRFERDQFRSLRVEIGQLAFEITRVVVGKDARFAAAVPDALDHRGVVELV